MTEQQAWGWSNEETGGGFQGLRPRPGPSPAQPPPHHPGHSPAGYPARGGHLPGEYSQVVLVNQDKKSVQGQEADGSPCRHVCGCEAPAQPSPPARGESDKAAGRQAGAAGKQTPEDGPPASRPQEPSPRAHTGPPGSSALTHVVGARQEVDHEAGLGQVRQDGVVHDHQHLLVEAQRQLPGSRRCGCTCPTPRTP